MLTVAAATPMLIVSLDLVHRHEMTGHFFAKTLRQDRGLRRIGFRQQHRKLFSSEPTDDIGIALAFEASGCDRHDTLVTNRMSVAVVDSGLNRTPALHRNVRPLAR
jgi:hypothetical protein